MANNEPGFPRCVTSGGQSVLSTPTAGMRLAPEILVWEFMRELYEGTIANPSDPKARDYNDNNMEPIPDNERLLLFACRGRDRKGRSKGRIFYAPAYPALSRHMWFRKKTDRALHNFLFSGALAHFDRNHPGEKLPAVVAAALVGARSATVGDDESGREILSLIAKNRPELPADELASRFERKTRREGPESAPLAGLNDELADEVGFDLIALCAAEKSLPRREWLFALTGYLRTATAVWLLSHLRITVLVRDWMVATCSGEPAPSADEILRSLRQRHAGLLHPTETPTREVQAHVERYMMARVETSLMLEWLTAIVPDKFTTSRERPRTLSAQGGASDMLGLDELLRLVKTHSAALIGPHSSIRQRLTREAEPYHAWRDPLKKGQGKNYNEFMRVLYRQPDDDSDSGLLIQSRDSTFSIVPGQRLLQLFAFLAASRKARLLRPGSKGKLVLRDLEEHFYRYGIDFRSSAYGRPLLLKKLAEGGLLVGSPDAGESAEILNLLGVT